MSHRFYMEATSEATDDLESLNRELEDAMKENDIPVPSRPSEGDEEDEDRIDSTMFQVALRAVRYDKASGIYSIAICNVETDLLERLLFLFDYPHEHKEGYIVSKNRLRLMNESLKQWIREGRLDECECQHLQDARNGWRILIRRVSERDALEIQRRLLDMV